MTTAPFAGDPWSPLLPALQQLRGTWPARGWSWDGRFSCVTSSFVVELEPKARASAGTVLRYEWSSTTIARAPAQVREIGERTGGLRSGQILLASSETAGDFAYGLWWPWGDGMTTSLRIGLAGHRATDSALQKHRDVFGVEV